MIYLILLLGLIFRLVGINQSLWLDEATTALVSQMPLLDFFTKFMPGDFHPPLYYLVVHFWVNIFGTSEISLRLPSIIFGLTTVYITFLISKEFKAKNLYFAQLLLATSGLHIYYSQEARMYAMAAFLTTLVIYLFLRSKWILFSICLSLLFLTDYLSMLVLPSLFIYAFLYNRKLIKNLFLSSIPFITTFILWLPYFLNQLANGIALKESSSGWWNILGTVNVKNIILIPIKFMIGRVSIDNNIIYSVVAFILLTIFGLAILKARNKFVWTWFLGSLVLGIILSIFIPTLTYFRYLFILPAFYLLVSENISKKLLILILFINLSSSIIYLTNQKFHREDWRQVSVEIGSEKVVFPKMSQTEALVYYGKGSQIITKEELTKNDGEIWLSRYVWNVFDPNDETRKYIEDLGYNMTQELNLNGVVFWKYTK